MSVKYFNSPEHQRMVREEHDKNLPILERLNELLDSGDLKVNRRTWVDNDLWEHGWVNCLGVQCKIKANSTIHECPLTPTKEGCWWVYAHLWRKANDKKAQRASIMRRHSDR